MPKGQQKIITKKLIFTLLPIISLAQVGIKTTMPTETLDVNGTMRIRNTPNGNINDSLLVIRNGVVKKISLNDIQNNQSSACPQLLQPQSTPFYLLFKSTASIPNPNNGLTINGKTFVSAGTWIQNNLYYFSYSNTSSSPLNMSGFSVQFGSALCNYH